MTGAASVGVPVAATDPGLRLSIGVSRSGKTYALRRQVYAAALGGVPVMVLDRLAEWRSLPAELAPLAAGAHDAAAGVELVKRGARLVLVRTRDVARDADVACRWARDHDGVAGVASSEAHRWLPNAGTHLPGVFEDCVLAWAHHRVSLWLDTQRLSTLHRTVTEQVAELRVHAVGGERDLERLRELGGRELSNAARECARRLVAGEPGWHVLVRTVAIPPYELARV